MSRREVWAKPCSAKRRSAASRIRSLVLMALAVSVIRMFETFVRFNYTYDTACVKPYFASCYTDAAGETVRPARHSAPLPGLGRLQPDQQLSSANYCGSGSSSAHLADDPG